MSAYEAALAAIAARRSLLATGSDLPWRTDRFFWKLDSRRGEADNWWASVENEFGTVARERDGGNEAMPDMVLIVAAVNAFAADTDALEALLLRHSPGDCRCHRCPKECDACGEWSSWPCSDARAALTALGVPHE